MEQKRGEGKQKFLKKGGEQAGSRGGCLKKGGAGTLLRTMTLHGRNPNYENLIYTSTKAIPYERLINIFSGIQSSKCYRLALHYKSVFLND